MLLVAIPLLFLTLAVELADTPSPFVDTPFPMVEFEQQDDAANNFPDANALSEDVFCIADTDDVATQEIEHSVSPTVSPTAYLRARGAENSVSCLYCV